MTVTGDGAERTRPRRQPLAGDGETEGPRRGPLIALLAAAVVSITGDSFTRIAAPWFVLATTGSAAKTGLAAFAAGLPSVVSAAIGGPLVDRLGLRRASVLTDVGCAVAIGLVPTLYLAGVLTFPGFLVAIAVASLLHSPGDTAREVLVPPLAEAARMPLTRAASAVDGVNRTARMVGLSLAGALVALLGAAPVLFLDAASFLVSAALVGLFVPAPRVGPPRARASGQGRAYLGDIADGLRFLWRERALRAVSLMVLVTNGLDQAFTGVLLPVYARTHGHSAASVAMVLGAGSLGQTVGAVAFGAIGHRLPRRATYTIAFMLVGAPKFVLVTAGLPLWALAGTLAVCAVPAGSLNPLIATVQYERVPPALRSRVFGACTACVLAAIPVGGLAAGYAAGGLDSASALLLFGGCYLLTTLTPLLAPAFRGLGRPPRDETWREPCPVTGVAATSESAD